MRKKVVFPSSRVCFGCKTELPLTNEYFYRSNTRYYQRECKKCNKIRRSKWWKSKKGKRSSRNTKLKSKYGISIKEFELLLEAWNYSCGICGKQQVIDSVELCVDHDHKTGLIRGILCQSCNLALGNFKDSIKNVVNGVDYLVSYSQMQEGLK